MRYDAATILAYRMAALTKGIATEEPHFVENTKQGARFRTYEPSGTVTVTFKGQPYTVSCPGDAPSALRAAWSKIIEAEARHEI